ncbi:MAG: chemotaxis protein CheW [Thermoanaerobaculia bacterium]
MSRDDQSSGAPESILSFADRLRAAREVREEVQETWEQWVVFRVSTRTLALPVTHVREILRLPELTGVPNAPRPVSGVMNLRGHVLPVVDTHALLELPQTMATPSSRVLVFLLDGRAVGLIVDEASGLEKLQVELFQTLPDSEALSSLARASYPRDETESITLLDPAKLFAGEDLAFK